MGLDHLTNEHTSILYVSQFLQIHFFGVDNTSDNGIVFKNLHFKTQF